MSMPDPAASASSNELPGKGKGKGKSKTKAKDKAENTEEGKGKSEKTVDQRGKKVTCIHWLKKLVLQAMLYDIVEQQSFQICGFLRLSRVATASCWSSRACLTSSARTLTSPLNQTCFVQELVDLTPKTDSVKRGQKLSLPVSWMR